MEEQKLQEYKKYSGIRVSIAVMMYILCPIPVILIENKLGLVLLFVIVALATGILIYNASIKPKELLEDEELLDGYISKSKIMKKRFASILLPLVTLAYLVISFTYNNWGISWIIFIAGISVKNIIEAICDMKYGGM